MLTLVYQYGVAAPHEGAEAVYDQMRRAHGYRRDFALIECARREAERAARSVSGADVEAAEADLAGVQAACEWLDAEIRQARKSSRKRSETVGARLQLALARAQAKAARERLYAARQRYAAQCRECRESKSEAVPCPHATPEARALRERLDAIDARAAELECSVRDHAGVHWGTYLVVERAHRASCAAPLYERDGVTPHDPDVPPARWDGEGTVGMHVQGKPLTVEDALAGKSKHLHVRAAPWPEEWLATAKLEARPPRRPDSVVGSGRGRRPPGTRPGFLRCRACRELDRTQPCAHASAMSTTGVARCRDCDRQPCPHAVADSPAPQTRADGTPARWVRDGAARHGELRMRVGYKDDPTCAAWRLDYHRPLPVGAYVTWVTVHRRTRGPHSEWSLCVTVNVEAAKSPPGETAREAAVAVDVGWRLIDGELRVAAWRDTAGRSGELRLSVADVAALRAHERVRSERDRAFDLCKLALRQWVATSSVAPDWMREDTRAMHAWRNPGRMVRLLRRWEAERPDRGAVEDAALQAVRAWATGDRARWASEEARRLWGLRRRKDKYRRFAAEICRRYGTVVVEQFDLRAVAERKPTGEDSAENEVARSNRQIAAISELRACLLEARHGATVVSVSAVDTTRTCPACGVVADRDAAAQVRLACECGHEWDQDVDGAAPILLARWVERPGDAKPLAGAREDSKSSEKLQKKGEKWARARRMGAAKKARITERS